MERNESLRADLRALRMDRDAEPAVATAKPRRRLPRWALLVAIALVAAIALLVSRRPVTVSVAPVTQADPATEAAAPVLSGSGYIVPGDKIVAIGTRVPGRVDRFLVDEGQLVQAGDPLVQIDDREYRAAFDRVEAQIASAEAELALAQSELARGRALRAKDFMSAQELDVRRNRVEVARARVAELEAGKREAQVSLENTVLRAPTDGVVLAKLKEAGEIVVPGGFQGSGELVRLANLSDLRAEIDVNESDLGLVRLGQRAEITPDADPEARFAGEVVKLYPQIDRQKGTLKVEVRVLDPDGTLLPDMSVRVSFLGAPEKGGDPSRTMLIPVAAVRRTADGRPTVFVVEDGRARARSVEEAGMRGDTVRITRGLAAGESVVVGSSPLEDGQRVRVGP
jgi:RND family efflux transporter MFP subunit